MNQQREGARRWLELLGALTTTQVAAQLAAGVLKPNDTRFAAVLGGVVFLATALIYLAWPHLGRPPHKPPSIGQRSFYLGLGLGAVAAGAVLWTSLRVQDALRLEARELLFSATFLSLAPYDSSATGVRTARVPLNSNRTEWQEIPVFQEAIYLSHYQFDWHVGGTFDDFTRCSGGAVVPTVLIPSGVRYKAESVEGSLCGQKTLAWSAKIDVGGTRDLLIIQHHYNCHFRDLHNSGHTMRIPVKHLRVVMDLSRLNRGQVFDETRQPRIVLVRKPYSDVEDITDRSRWSEGLLLGEARDLGPTDEVWLWCEYLYRDPRLKLLTGSRVD